MHELIAPTFNVSVLIITLVYFLREPTRAFVSERHTSLKEELERVAAQLREAHEKYNEFSAKLKAIDAEIAGLNSQMRQDAEAMKARIIADVRRVANIIVIDAKAASETLFTDLKNQLRAELSTQVLARAETILTERLTGDDKARIRREFSKQVESSR